MNNAIRRRMAELEAYRPQPTARREDLDAFWNASLRKFAEKPLNDRRERVPTFLDAEVFRVRYEGFDDTPIHGWYLVPRRTAEERLPCVVLFHGYGGDKGEPEQYAHWLLMGMCVFAVDVRGQAGETGNRLASRHGIAKGWVSQGILDKQECYYHAVAIDCLKAVDWAAAQEEVDPGRIYLHGSSQGGGLVLLTAALSDKPALVSAHVPNMCHMDYGLLHSTGSLAEIARFLTLFPEHYDTVLETLGYFDVMNLAERIRIPVLMSVGLKDVVCLPEMIYAAYNRMRCEKRLVVYPFMGHEGSRDFNRRTYEWFKREGRTAPSS